MPRPHICAACDPPAFRPSPTAGLMSAFDASVYHRLRKAQPCSLREWDGRTWKKLERAKGFEPSTPTLARSCSTPELHPHPRWVRWIVHRALVCQTGSRIATIPVAAAEHDPENWEPVFGSVHA